MVLTIITISAEFDSLVIMLFLTLLDFMKLKYTDKTGACDSFVFIVLVMKI